MVDVDGHPDKTHYNYYDDDDGLYDVLFSALAPVETVG